MRLKIFRRVKTSLIDVPELKRGMIQAKNNSNFGSAEKHEEGGFILKDKNGNLSTQAWLAGDTDRLYYRQAIRMVRLEIKKS